MTDALQAELAAPGHRLEQLAEEPAKFRWIGAGLLHDPGENLIGQKTDVFGEQAEDHAVEEMRDAPGVQPALAHGLGNARELLGRILGDRFARLPWPQFFRVEEHCPQDFQTARLAELFKRDFVGRGNGLREVGMNDDPVKITDHEQRRTGRAWFRVWTVDALQ
ncbi:MAG: hypothetical protein HY360_26920 [Verrucomicrobia bacterium]|nr:hypothetical protein [Verrucomicrobiota bacterium]